MELASYFIVASSCINFHVEKQRRRNDNRAKGPTEVGGTTYARRRKQAEKPRVPKHFIETFASNALGGAILIIVV